MKTDRRRRIAAVLALGVLEGAVAMVVRAQLVSDDVPRERTIPEQERVKEDMSRARLRLGPIRVLPGFSVTNAGYDNNVFATSTDAVGDWSFTLNAGARFLVPLGSKLYLRADAFPQYTWYDKLADRRGFGGTYQAGMLGFFNRMTFELGGNGSEGYNTYSSELNSRVLSRNVGGFGRLEIAVTHKFSLFGSGEVQRVRYSQPDGPPDQQAKVRLNNRTDGAARGGVRYHISSRWNVGAVVEETWSSFEATPETRDNRSTAYLVSLHYDRPQFFVNLTGGYRQGRADNGSSFPDYSTGTGSFFVSYFPIRGFEVQGYGRRRVSYSISVTDPYYFENRIGGGLNIQVIPRITLRGYGEVGPNEYPLSQSLDGTGTKQRDQVHIYGGGLSIALVRQAVLTGLVTRNSYNSNVPSNDRAFTRFTMNVSFGGEFSR